MEPLYPYNPAKSLEAVLQSISYLEKEAIGHENRCLLHKDWILAV